MCIKCLTYAQPAGGSGSLAGLLICFLPLSLPVLGLWWIHGPDGLEILTCFFCLPATPWAAHPHASHPSLPAACQEGLKNTSYRHVLKGGSASTVWNPPQIRVMLLHQDVPWRFPQRSAGLIPYPNMAVGPWLTHAWVYACGKGGLLFQRCP